MHFYTVKFGIFEQVSHNEEVTYSQLWVSSCARHERPSHKLPVSEMTYTVSSRTLNPTIPWCFSSSTLW